METRVILQDWLEKAAAGEGFAVRIQGWERVVDWLVDGVACRFRLGPAGVTPLSPGSSPEPDLRVELDRATLDEIVSGRLHFFLAWWGAGRLKFTGPLGDAYRLGYLLGHDRRSRRVAFVTHCWLNLNTRFPGGGTHAGAVPAVAQALVDSGVGIAQMPCPELRCFGLEKYTFGALGAEQVRESFRRTAGEVLEDLAAYQRLGYEVVAIIGMDPSPSCGVTRAKGKRALLGLDSDTGEAPGPGVFIEELRRSAQERHLVLPPVLGLRRMLSPGEGAPEGLGALREVLERKPDGRPTHPHQSVG